MLAIALLLFGFKCLCFNSHNFNYLCSPAELLDTSCVNLKLVVSNSHFHKCEESFITITAHNESDCIAPNAYLAFNHGDNFENFSSNSLFEALSASTYQFNLGDIPAFSSRTISIRVLVSCDAPDGFVHFVTAEVTADNQCSDSDLNQQSIYQMNVGNNGHNNVRVSNIKGHNALTYDEDDFQYYHIRFQNTTNNPTTFGLVNLHLDKHLDLNTFEVLGSSHLFSIDISFDTIVNFQIPDLALAPSSTNFEASLGFVSCRIKPYPDLDANVELRSFAQIKLDQNPFEATNAVLANLGAACEDVSYGYEIQYACAGEEVSGYFENGIHEDFLQSVDGCDSFRVLNIIHYPNYALEDSISICVGDNYNGLTSDTTIINSYQTINGCDSIHGFTLKVQELEDFVELTEFICAGDSFGGYSTSGIYTDTIAQQGKCVQQVLDLRVLDAIVENVEIQLCEGESFGIYTEEGMYADTLQSFQGCDSIIQTSISFYENDPNNYINVSICEGEDYEGLTANGNYQLEYESVNGCDSLLGLVLTVHPNYNAIIGERICFGEEFMGQSESGTYEYTFGTIHGCDSMVTLNLSVVPHQTIDIDTSICSGQNYEGLDQEGFYTFEEQSVFGCDSIVNIDLKVNASYYRDIDTTICHGRNIFGIKEPGEYFLEYQTYAGCDSIINLKLDVLPFDHQDCEIVDVYPNPVRSRMRIEIFDPGFETGYYEIYTIDGKFITKKIMASPLDILEMDEYKSGVYFLMVNYNQRRYHKQFVKVN